MIRVVAKNGVVYYRSELLSCPHGFSTRLGGVSALPHTAKLNLGFDRGDSHETVKRNLFLFGEALGLDAEKIISAPQIHSAHVRYVTPAHAGEGFFRMADEACDGYVTDCRGIVPGVRTADCVPVLIYAPADGKSFAGAVAAVHAGWRGTAAGIVCVAVEKLVELGACRERIRGAIGPAIGACCYEVREDFYQAFLDMAGKELTDRYVLPNANKKGYWQANLTLVNYELLIRSGVLDSHIDRLDLCTCCNPHEFFSHRYSNGIRGTMLSVISLPE